jgi:hypothetical protein
MEVAMKKILAVAVLSLIVPFTVDTASAAPWCVAMPNEGGALQCRFTSLAQCNGTASGIGGECYRNPRLAYGSMPRPATRGHRYAPNNAELEGNNGNSGSGSNSLANPNNAAGHN